jgi:hypothetical protein
MLAVDQYSKNRGKTQHPHDIEFLKTRTDCREIASRYLGAPRTSHPNYVQYLAPHRAEHTASFTIYADHFYDFGTSEHGDALNLIQLLEKCDLRRAIEILAEFAGERPPTAKPVRQSAQIDSPLAAQTEPPPAVWRQALRKIIKTSKKDLRAPRWAAKLSYLHQRGLNDATIDAAKLGYNPQWLNLTINGQHITIGPGLLIPWYIDGLLWAVHIRPDSGKPKYIYVAGGKNAGALYNADAIRSGLPVVAVEGEFDALLMQQQAGDLAAFVATGGASGHIPAGYREAVAAAPYTALIHDNDTAGQHYAERNGAGLPDGYLVLNVPHGKDPTDYLIDHHGDLRAWFSEAIAAASVDTSFVEHHANGLRDNWAGLFRRFCKQGAAAMFIYIEAIRHGLHKPYQPISATKLARYHIELGFAAAQDFDKLEHLYRQGLKALAQAEVLVTQSNTPTVAKTSTSREISYLPRSLDEIVEILLWYLDPQLDKQFYPGYSSDPQDGDPQPVRLDLQAKHFFGEYTTDVVDAYETAAAFARLPVQSDVPTEKRAKRRKVKRIGEIRQALYEDQQVTPLALDAVFSNYSEFDAARYWGKVYYAPDQEVTWDQEQWTDFLGVTRSSLGNLRKKTGLTTQQDFSQRLAIQRGAIEPQVRGFARKVQGRPIKIVASDAVTRSSYTSNYSVAVVREHLEAGHAVQVIFQTASITSIDPNGPQLPAEKPPQEKAAPAPAEPTAQEQPKPAPRRSWLWSQVILNLLCAGYTEQQVVHLSLAEAIALVRERARQNPPDALLDWISRDLGGVVHDAGPTDSPLSPD